MKKNFSFVLAIALLSAGCDQPKPVPAQKGKLNQPSPVAPPEKVIPPNLDKSPMDIIYFPVNFPVLKMSGKARGEPIARVMYSRPSTDGRVIFGQLVKYGVYWRLGANESTEIEFFTDVTITGKKIGKGRYVMYCIPYQEKWTIVLNKDLFTWGLKIKTSMDLASFDIPVIPVRDKFEYFTMEFEPEDHGMQLMMAWENVKVSLPIRY